MGGIAGNCVRGRDGQLGRPVRSRLRVAAALAAAAVALAVAPSTAGASTASVSGGTDLTYNAAAGETNNVTVSLDGAVYRITDPGATITPMFGCAAVNANEVTCTAAGVDRVDLQLDDLGDTNTLSPTVTVRSDISGEAGQDTLNGGDGARSSLFGGADNDTLNAGAAGARLDGDAGNDTVNGGAGFDDVEAGLGDDVGFGNGGEDSFDGGSAPDGADTFNGGPGIDDLRYGSRTADVTATLDGVADDGEAGEGDNVMPDIERVDGGQGNDLIVGGPANEELRGAAGNDTVRGGAGDDQTDGDDGDDSVAGDAGNDVVRGGDGIDLVDGGEGDDVLESFSFVVGSDDGADVLGGGPGSDLLVMDNATDPLAVTLDGAAGDGLAGEGDNALGDLEGVVGGTGPDLLVGNASANQLEGGPGADGLVGLGGADGLLGQRGDDALDGGQDPDLLDGAGGADRLRTRDSGPDQALCGAGVDAVLADSDDAPGADCEQSSSGIAIEGGKVKLKGDAARLGLACPAVEGVDCKGKLTLKKGKRTLAAKKVSIPSGESEDVKLKLKGKAAKSLAGDRKIPADASARMTDAAGETATTEEPVKLVRGGKS